VDVVIVNWNTAENAIRAAHAFGYSSGVETRVKVVDNDSEPDQRRLLKGADGFELIEAGDNLGFGRAANLGASTGTAPYLLVSNADLSPEPGAVVAMVEAARNKEIGLVGPVFDGDQNIYHDNLPSAFVLLVRTLVGGFGREPIPPPGPGQELSIQQPSGACFLIRRDLWERVGGFDDGFFLWYEDVDLARRLHDLGFSSLIVGSARVEHLGGESFAQISEGRLQQIRLDSLDRYIKLHHKYLAVIAKPFLWLSRKVRTRGEE